MRVQASRIGVCIDEARPVLSHHSKHRRATRATVHPDAERGIFRVLSCLKEPKKGVDRVVRIDTEVPERAWRQMDISGVRLDALCRLTEARLVDC